MGANATTKVPSYAAGQVLTAADLSITNSGIPVFANSTDRTNSFGGTGEKPLAEGQYAYLEDDNKTYVYDGAAWQVVGDSGLVLVKSQTIGSAVASVTVSDVFSSTYDNYKILIVSGAASTNLGLRLTLGATATGYYWAYTGTTYANVAQKNAAANGTYWVISDTTATSFGANIDLIGPNLTENTFYYNGFIDNSTSGAAGVLNGFLNDTTAYTAFTITCSTGNITGGTIRVYGYKN